MKTSCYSRAKIIVPVAVATLVLAAVAATGCLPSADAGDESDAHLILNCTFDYLKTGESRRYHVKQSPAAAGYEVLWESGDELVATVDKEGTVTAVGAGETTVTASAYGAHYKAKMKLTVADEIVSEKDGVNAAQLAVDKAKNDSSVLIIGGYYPSLKVNKRLTVTCVEGAAFGGISVEKDAELFLYYAKVSAPSTTEANARVSLGENASLTAVACAFSYIDPTEETRSYAAISAPSDAAGIYCRACSFSGYEICVKAGATDGEIYLVNNDFSDAETAVEIDLRADGTTADKNAYGKIADNVYVGCKKTVKLYYNAPSYTGSLDISDADVRVPS